MSAETFYAALDVDLPGTGPKAPVRCFASPDAHKHDDRNPSAEVYREKGTWHCHGCGDWGGPYKAALAHGLAERDAMALVAEHGLDVKEGDERPSPARREPKPPPELATTELDLERDRKRLADDQAALDRLGELRGWTGEAVARLGLGLDDAGRLTFPVRSADRQLVGVVRHAPNVGRRQAKADPGSRRDLFPAPESLGGDPLYVVEGEPDAVAAASLGIPAVALPGVGKWDTSWAARFAGRRLVVCLDSDEPGRKAAQERAQQLVPHAAEVRIIDLDPSRTDGYDLGDWCLEASRNGGHSSGRHALEQLVKHADPLAHLERVGGSELLDELATFVRRFVVMSDAQVTAVALWIVHTHAADAAEQTPYLAVTSAEKRSGKSRLLDVLELLCARAWRAVMPSEAVVYRKLDRDRPTLLLDEVDAIFKSATERTEPLRALLNAGNRRGTTVPRCVGQNLELRDFATFGPKALAGIGKLPDTVADRSMPICMQRRLPAERVERFRRRSAEAEAKPLAERVAAFASEHAEQLAAARPEVPAALDDRAADGWEPLLAIADNAGGEWGRRARAAALELASAAEDEDSLGVRLLADVRTVLIGERMTSADLAAALCALEEAPWGDLRGRELDSRGLARRLKPYGIAPHSIQFPEGKARGYRREQFADAWRRYLAARSLDEPSERSTVPSGSVEPKTADSQAFHSESRNAQETAANPHSNALRNGGTDNEAEKGAEAA